MLIRMKRKFSVMCFSFSSNLFAFLSLFPPNVIVGSCSSAFLTFQVSSNVIKASKILAKHSLKSNKRTNTSYKRCVALTFFLKRKTTTRTNQKRTILRRFSQHLIIIMILRANTHTNNGTYFYSRKKITLNIMTHCVFNQDHFAKDNHEYIRDISAQMKIRSVNVDIDVHCLIWVMQGTYLLSIRMLHSPRCLHCTVQLCSVVYACHFHPKLIIFRAEL